MTRFRLLVAATVLASTALVAGPQAGRAAPVEECTTVMTPTAEEGCTLDLDPGDHRIRLDMVSVTGAYVLQLRDSTGRVFYEARCNIEPTHGECSGTYSGTDEARVSSSASGTISFGVTHTDEVLVATLSKGGTASLEAGPGAGAVTLFAT